MDYTDFLERKRHLAGDFGFEPVFFPDQMFPFQRRLLEWSVKKGRSAVFADCGLGKTILQLAWAENVAQKTGGKVLVLTPLSVSYQTIHEGEKFGIECERSSDGKASSRITVTNYERLHLFDSSDFVGLVCDESSILKNYDGTRRSQITEFSRKLPYRLLCTATAAPNDFTELGTSSEALGIMGHMDMLGRFFRDARNSVTQKNFSGAFGKKQKWRFKKHAELPFWRWVCSWARAVRKPSDLGFPDGRFVLPPLDVNQVVVENTKPLPGELFARPAVGWREQRAEMRNTIEERCEKAAELVHHKDPAIVWCNLNDEGNLLESLIPDCVQVSGSDSDDKKEEVFRAFSDGSIRVLVTKPKIAAFGLNWQHCAHMTFFPSHSYEQFYQSVRRCWRFGQKNPVRVDIVATEGTRGILQNLNRKAEQAEKMFSMLVDMMGEAQSIDTIKKDSIDMEVPEWLS